MPSYPSPIGSSATKPTARHRARSATCRRPARARARASARAGPAFVRRAAPRRWPCPRARAARCAATAAPPGRPVPPGAAPAVGFAVLELGHARIQAHGGDRPEPPGSGRHGRVPRTGDSRRRSLELVRTRRGRRVDTRGNDLDPKPPEGSGTSARELPLEARSSRDDDRRARGGSDHPSCLPSQPPPPAPPLRPRRRSRRPPSSDRPQSHPRSRSAARSSVSTVTTPSLRSPLS